MMKVKVKEENFLSGVSEAYIALIAAGLISLIAGAKERAWTSLFFSFKDFPGNVSLLLLCATFFFLFLKTKEEGIIWAFASCVFSVFIGMGVEIII